VIQPDDPRLTAFALGKLDPLEQSEVQAQLAHDEAARRHVEVMRETISLLAEALATRQNPAFNQNDARQEADVSPIRRLTNRIASVAPTIKAIRSSQAAEPMRRPTTMCTCEKCQSWTETVVGMTNQVYRGVAILEYICPHLPPQAQLGVQKASNLLASKKAPFEDAIRARSSRCPEKLPGPEKTQLDAQRAEVVEGCAWMLEQVLEILEMCTQYLPTIQQLNYGYALDRYMGMMDQVGREQVDFTRRSAQQWDTLYAETRQRQRLIDRMTLDAISGSPFVKAYFIT
jgi:hypothetical protein